VADSSSSSSSSSSKVCTLLSDEQLLLRLSNSSLIDLKQQNRAESSRAAVEWSAVESGVDGKGHLLLLHKIRAHRQ